MTKKLIIIFSFLLIILFSIHYGSPFLPDKLVLILVIALLAALFGIGAAREGQISLPRNIITLPLLVFLGYIVIQTAILHPANQRYTFESMLLFFMIVLFLLYFSVGFGNRDDSMTLIKSVIFANCLLLVVYLLRTAVHLKAGGHVFSGWLVNHNHLAMLAGMLIPYTIALSVYRHQPVRDRILWFASLFIVLVSFLFAVSRGAYVSFVLALSITVLGAAWLGVYSKKTGFILFGSGLLVGIFVLSLYPFEHRVFSSVFAITASQRLGIWFGSIRMFLHHPVFGWGIGTYEDAFHRFRPSDILYLVNHAHDVFLETADDMGIIGLGLVLWALVTWLSVIIREMKQTSSDLKKAVLWAGLTSTLFLIFHNFIDFGILVPSNAVSAILLMAGTASVLQVSAHNLPLDYIKVFSKRQRLLVAAFSTVFFIAVAVVCMRAVYGYRLYEQGRHEMAERNGTESTGMQHRAVLDQAIKTFTRAQRFITSDKVVYATGTAWYKLFDLSGEPEALDHALVQFKRASRLCPWNPYYAEDIGALYEHQGDLHQAIASTRQALTLDPTNASLFLRIGDLELDQGSDGDAIHDYKQACRIYPPYAWDVIPRLIMFDVPLDEIRKTARELPDGTWVLVNALIKTPRVSLDNSPLPGQTLTGTIQTHLGHAQDVALAAGILKGLMLTDTGKLIRYIPLFIDITPDKTQALEQLEGLHISDKVMLFYIAVLESQTGDSGAAMQTLQYIIHTDASYADAYRMIANIDASENKLDDAIGVLKTGLYYVPSDFLMYAMLGAFYNQDRDWYNAIESYKMAVLLNPGYENGYVQMAMIYKAQGMEFRAKDILEQGIDALPKSTTIRQMLQDIKE